MRILAEQDVERLIDPVAAIAAMADAYRRHSTGRMPAPGRLDLPRDTPKGSVLVLAGYSEQHTFATKANMHVYAEATSRQRKAASMMVLWDSAACEPKALIATTLFNNHRTAAALAAAAEALAPPDVRRLTVFGAGKIAPAVIRYLSLVRSFERILIAGRASERSSALAHAIRSWNGFASCDVRAATDPAEAIRDADVIVTITTAAAPVFPGKRTKRGALVILAGANRPEAREADDDLMARATIYVDHHSACIERAGDLRIPLEIGHLKIEQVVGEIGALLAGSRAPRPNADVTVFKSMGVIAQDLVLAELVLARAIENGVGVDFDPDSGAVQHPSTFTVAAKGAIA